MNVLTFYGDVAAFGRAIEFYSLAKICGKKGSLGYRLSRIEVWAVARIVVLIGLFQLQFIQFRLVLPPNNGRFRADNVHDDDFIASFLQPAAREIERLLRPDTPETTERMPIDIDLTLAPLFKIQERIAHLFQVEVTAIIADRRRGKVDRTEATIGFIQLVEGLLCRFMAVGNRCNHPILEMITHIMAIDLCVDGHTFGNSLKVFHGPSEVNAPHRFDKNG